MGMATRFGKPLLTRADWTRVALEAVGRGGGVHAIAVDRLAKQLGATRGSFYWHFKDREELVRATLDLWEREHTTELIPEALAIEDPVERLRALFRMVYEQPVDPVEVALASTADDPLVGPAVARVTRLRVRFLRDIFTELGLDEAEADARAWLAYAFYVGHHQLGRAEGTGRPERLERVVALLATRT
jgi:AcrR family transcriptional regulator